MKLKQVIRIVEEKCCNCHQCIAACPVKFANNGSDSVIHVNADLCIGCGECVKACTHEARQIVDDCEHFLQAAARKDKLIAIVAPAIAANFPGAFLRFNGWLKSLGVEAVFDVSFGAELTVRSYLHHIAKEAPKSLIAQPCPAIVSYIQIYQPELIRYLAPAHSPMLHTILMVKRFYPALSSHKVVAISPCIAKKREFDESGLGDYNVTFTSLIRHFEAEGVSLSRYPETEYDNDAAERAVLFSSPGGLTATAERDYPGIGSATRKIEGVHTIYKYLNTLSASIEKGSAPLMIDCLNCEMGCNGGSGTASCHASQDDLEGAVRIRKQQLLERHATSNPDNALRLDNLRKTIDRYWVEDYYTREYRDLSANYRSLIKEPDQESLNEILHSMAKFKTEDLKNCASCGYNSCTEMAKAIFNGLNRKENCHFYLDHQIKEYSYDLISNSEELLSAVEKIKDLIAT